VLHQALVHSQNSFDGRFDLVELRRAARKQHRFGLTGDVIEQLGPRDLARADLVEADVRIDGVDNLERVGGGEVLQPNALALLAQDRRPGEVERSVGVDVVNRPLPGGLV